eukprot:jgi/Psemu1/32895/gm1.32895_g
MKRSYDSADHRAKAHQKLQLTRELKVERKASSHPSVGGSKGYDLCLVVCIIIYPQTQLGEIAMYLYNNGVGLYSNQLISLRLKKLQITNKKPSIEAFKAYFPANIRRELLFWNRQLPIGVVGIPRKYFTDKVQKLAVMIAVEPWDPELPADVTGSIARPRQWVGVRRTNIDDWGVFLWDNLSSHYSQIIYETVMGRVGPTRFNILPRPAYQPKYEPIKYVICQLLNHMKVNVTGKLGFNQMEQQILDLEAAIGRFDATFAHCGCSEDCIHPGVEVPINPNASPPGWGLLGPPGAG